MSSSLLPLNIGPQTTSSQPPRSGVFLITGRSLGGGPDGREAVEDPVRVEPSAPVRLAVEADEVAGARVHRQARLGREEAVVAVDQVVDLVERPARGERAPALRELRGV